MQSEGRGPQHSSEEIETCYGRRKEADENPRWQRVLEVLGQVEAIGIAGRSTKTCAERSPILHYLIPIVIRRRPKSVSNRNSTCLIFYSEELTAEGLQKNRYTKSAFGLFY